jgi:hypothetical protein
MPNWCHNTLDVTGLEEDLARFVEHAKLKDGGEEVQPLTFTADAPEPEYGNSDDDGLFPDWYSWRVANWGTKWDASFGGGAWGVGEEGMDLEKSIEAQGVQKAKMAAVYKFDTAWSPPYAWLKTAAEKWPALTFVLRFGEVGGGFAGQLTYVNGKQTEELELAVEDVLAPEEMWF